MASLVQHLLTSHTEILRRFGLCVSADGRLESIPDLLGGYEPDLIGLPALVLGLANDIEWEADAMSLVQGIAEVLSNPVSLSCFI